MSECMFQLDLDAIVREVDADERRRKVIRRFQRTMKRHEHRARRMGLPATAEHIHDMRLDPHPDRARDERTLAEILPTSGERMAPRMAFLLSRAAEAMARLRSDLEAVK